jgi:hypothetical protein
MNRSRHQYYSLNRYRHAGLEFHGEFVLEDGDLFKEHLDIVKRGITDGYAKNIEEG